MKATGKAGRSIGQRYRLSREGRLCPSLSLLEPLQMATVSKHRADKLIALDGYYADNPRVLRIVEYDNAWGGVGYGLEYAYNLGRYSPSEFVRNPRIYWEAD